MSSSWDREFDSLERAQVRELEIESLAKRSPRRSAPRIEVEERRPVRESETEMAAKSLRALPKFRRSLVESRRAMRSRATPTSMSAALFAAVPMTVLTVASRV